MHSSPARASWYGNMPHLWRQWASKTESTRSCTSVEFLSFLPQLATDNYVKHHIPLRLTANRHTTCHVSATRSCRISRANHGHVECSNWQDRWEGPPLSKVTPVPPSPGQATSPSLSWRCRVPRRPYLQTSGAAGDGGTHCHTDSLLCVCVCVCVCACVCVHTKAYLGTRTVSPVSLISMANPSMTQGAPSPLPWKYNAWNSSEDAD